METVEFLVRNPWTTSNASAASLFRSIEDKRPTVFLDETDALFKGDKETAQAIRGILNAGAHHKGVVSRCIGKGTGIKSKDFSAFCPKALGGIGGLPDTVADRSLPIRLKRKMTGEKVERLRERYVEPLAKPLRAALAKWMGRQLPTLKDAEPELPRELNDRQQDGAEPLLAIADAAGGDWPTKARRALVELYLGDASKDDSKGVRLLADIREFFGEAEAVFTTDLLAALNEIETSPWGEWKGKGLNCHSLAKLLEPYGIEPRGTVRIGDDTKKGYRREQFLDSWERYLSNPLTTPEETSHPSQCSNHAGLTHFSMRHTDSDVTDSKSEESPVNTRVVTDVTLKTGGNGDLGSKPITGDRACPGCELSRNSTASMRFHLHGCKPFGWTVMLKVEAALDRGETIDGDLAQRYRRYLDLGLGRLDGDHRA